MNTKLSRLRAMIVANPWCILPSLLETMAEIVERRVEGVYLSSEEIAEIKFSGEPCGLIHYWSLEGLPIEAIEAAAGGGSQNQPVIAVINVVGVIAQHSRQVDGISGPAGTSVERITQSFRAALADPNVKSIVLNFDSPGGNVFGIEALSDELFKARGLKPVVAQVNSLAASAAYWLATQADEIVVTPGGQVGSIGAYALHEDKSAATEKAGVKYTYISAGKYKIEGNPYAPLDDEAAQAAQKKVDAYYTTFVNAVARGRGVKSSEVREGFGQGRMEMAKDALRLGMADRIATLDDTLKRVSRRPATLDSSKASAVEFEQRVEGDERKLYLVGEWPAQMLIASELLKQSWIEVDHENGLLTFVLENACALYRRDSVDGDCWRCSRLVWRAERPPVLIERAEQSAEERDAFRRRRHAHRVRVAG